MRTVPDYLGAAGKVRFSTLILPNLQQREKPLDVFLIRFVNAVLKF